MRKRIVSTTLITCAVLLAGHQDSSSESATAYFVAAKPGPFGSSDSYVLPLTDPGDIALARDLIATGGFKIIVASIAPGADGINQDIFNQILWSWHVTEFVAFAEITIELCDGSPTLVEEAGGCWAGCPDGGICFWDYTVVLEIPRPVAVEEATWGRIKDSFRHLR